MVDERTKAAAGTIYILYAFISINQQVAYSLEGACTNYVEAFFACMHRAEQGYQHHSAGVYLGRYAQESDAHLVDNGSQVRGLVALAVVSEHSVEVISHEFCNKIFMKYLHLPAIGARSEVC
jgi:hypothetical protein